MGPAPGSGETRRRRDVTVVGGVAARAGVTSHAPGATPAVTSSSPCDVTGTVTKQCDTPVTSPPPASPAGGTAPAVSPRVAVPPPPPAHLRVPPFDVAAAPGGDPGGPRGDNGGDAQVAPRHPQPPGNGGRGPWRLGTLMRRVPVGLRCPPYRQPPVPPVFPGAPDFPGASDALGCPRFSRYPRYPPGSGVPRCPPA
ncbi:basic proline-rich protein-like [Vidua macroura]|uniref:basic proline-rich protein-like n=1 Tax=Vidua macroura TaxID=187451 RepID=UPI0023A8E729|nr:basic proline-rich protein-like [Vidua macroura]